MATIIESDGIRVEGESERAAMRELRKARKIAAQQDREQAEYRERALELARVSAWRLLDAFVEGWETRCHWAYVEANKPCGPMVSIRSADGTRVAWQSANGDAATQDFYGHPKIAGGIIDAGGWLLAILVDDRWNAVGSFNGATAMEQLPSSFAFPQDRKSI